MSHSEEIREQVLNHFSNGSSIKDIIEIYNISRSSFQRWRKSKLETGSVSIKPRVVEPYKLNNTDLISYITKNPDAYIQEIAEEFQVTNGCISIALKRLKISRKKKPFVLRKR